MTNTALQKRVNAALAEDEALRSEKATHGILVHRNDIAKARPFSLEYMESLGLKKADLKKLKSAGLAYNGLALFNDKKYHSAWILVTDEGEPRLTKENQDEKSKV